jgi:molybdopterin synthase sulfur carrier subunit
MVKVKIYGTLQTLLKIKELNMEYSENLTIRTLLEKIQKKVKPDFIQKLIDKNGGIIPGTIILVNKKNIFHLNKLETEINDNDEIVVFPPGAGG